MLPVVQLHACSHPYICLQAQSPDLCCLCTGTCELAQALPHATCLTYLDLSSCNIGDSGASDLADAIADPFFSIHDKAALTEEFHGHAPTPAAVQVLKLRDNKMSEPGVQELGEAMQQSSSLHELDVAGTQVLQLVPIWPCTSG